MQRWTVCADLFLLKELCLHPSFDSFDQKICRFGVTGRTVYSWFSFLAQLASLKKLTNHSHIHVKVCSSHDSSHFKTQIAKLHHHVVEIQSGMLRLSTLLRCVLDVVVVSFETKVFPYLPFSPNFHFILYLLLISSIPDPPLLCYPPSSSALHLVFFVSSCFQLGEDLIHAEEQEADLGKTARFLLF